VLLTTRFHERSAAEVVERHAARVWAHADAVPRLALGAAPVTPGALLPGGVQGFETGRPNELAYWIPVRRTLVVGDVLVGADGGVRLCPDSWYAAPEGPGRARDGLRALLDLPADRLLVSHGAPVLAGGRDAVAAALATGSGA
jgi:hypothetical protein